MATIRAPLQVPPVLVPKATILNGYYPQSGTGRVLLDGLNHVLAYRRKTIFSHFADLETLSTTQANPIQVYRGYFRTGEGATSTSLNLFFHWIMGPAGNVAAVDPFSYWSLKKVGGATTTTTEAHFGPFKATPWGPSSLGEWTAFLPVDRNSEYEFWLNVENYGRPVGACVFEVHDSSFTSASPVIVSDPGTIAMGNPITDLQHSQMMQYGLSIWKHNGAHLFSWGLDEDPTVGGGQAPTRTSATAANAFDQTKTTFAANDRGVKLQTRYHSPAHATTTTACVFAAWGKVVSTSSGTVTLRDSGGTLATLSTFSSAGEWKTTTFNLSGTVDTTELQFYIAGGGDDVNGFTLGGLSIYENVT
jgi:hypothetical protein